jgi:hypothetical protein
MLLVSHDPGLGAFEGGSDILFRQAFDPLALRTATSGAQPLLWGNASTHIPRTAPRPAASPSQEHRWTSAPATTSTAISTSASRRSASTTGRSTPMAGSRSRSLTLLSSVGALPSASTRSGSRRKSGAGAAPIAWRPLFICGYRSSVAQNANISARRQAFECCAQFKPPGAANGGTTSRALQGRPAPSMASRRCCKRAPPTHSQLLRGWKCAYTRANKDSATMTVQRHFRWKMTALSPESAGIRPSLRCLGAWEAMLRGFQTISR